MANLALIARHNHPVALRSDRQVATIDSTGPGRLLHHAYTVAGRCVEKGLGSVAHKFGMGPAAISNRIEKAFGDDPSTRQSMLDCMYDSFQDGGSTQNSLLCALNKDCRKLLEYALPSQTLATQIQTFRQIITLTTRYPGLRRIFLQSPDIAKVADSPAAICELWPSTTDDHNEQSRFLLEFAANCLARNDPNVELEGIRPSELGCVREGCLGVVDKLIIRHCNEGSGFPRLIAIRYVAGILELPRFWSENYQVQKVTMDKLCKQTLRLIEDINPESVSAEDCRILALLDPGGIDELAEAILTGGKKWIEQQPRMTLGSDYWLTNFVKLIVMLRGLTMPEFLPMAYRRAGEDWEGILKDVKDELPMSRVNYEFEDVYDFVTRRSGVLPDLFQLRRSKVAEESVTSEVVEESMTSSPEATAAFRAHYVRLNEISNQDIVIVIMGLTGSGKSNFIDVVTHATEKRASSSFRTWTQEVQAVRLRNHKTYHDRLVLVDTPGFDDTDRSDMEILELIGEWLKKTYEAKITLAGIIYLHRISDNRMAGSPYFRMFCDLCGDKAAEKVVLVTSMWDRVDPMIAQRRESELIQDYWKPMLDHGASHNRFDNSESSAWRVLEPLIAKQHLRQVLLLQEELVDLKKHINETKAGLVIYDSLRELFGETETGHQEVGRTSGEESSGSPSDTGRTSPLSSQH